MHSSSITLGLCTSKFITFSTGSIFVSNMYMKITILVFRRLSGRRTYLGAKMKNDVSIRPFLSSR